MSHIFSVLPRHQRLLPIDSEDTLQSADTYHIILLDRTEHAKLFEHVSFYWKSHEHDTRSQRRYCRALGNTRVPVRTTSFPPLFTSVDGVTDGSGHEADSTRRGDCESDRLTTPHSAQDVRRHSCFPHGPDASDALVGHTLSRTRLVVPRLTVLHHLVPLLAPYETLLCPHLLYSPLFSPLLSAEWIADEHVAESSSTTTTARIPNHTATIAITNTHKKTSQQCSPTRRVIPRFPPAAARFFTELAATAARLCVPAQDAMLFVSLTVAYLERTMPSAQTGRTRWTPAPDCIEDYSTSSCNTESTLFMCSSSSSSRHSCAGRSNMLLSHACAKTRHHSSDMQHSDTTMRGKSSTRTERQGPTHMHDLSRKLRAFLRCMSQLALTQEASTRAVRTTTTATATRHDGHDNVSNSAPMTSLLNACPHDMPALVSTNMCASMHVNTAVKSVGVHTSSRTHRDSTRDTSDAPLPIHDEDIITGNVVNESHADNSSDDSESESEGEDETERDLGTLESAVEPSLRTEWAVFALLLHAAREWEERRAQTVTPEQPMGCFAVPLTPRDLPRRCDLDAGSALLRGVHTTRHRREAAEAHGAVGGRAAFFEPFVPRDTAPSRHPFRLPPLPLDLQESYFVPLWQCVMQTCVRERYAVLNLRELLLRNVGDRCAKLAEAERERRRLRRQEYQQLKQQQEAQKEQVQQQQQHQQQQQEEDEEEEQHTQKEQTGRALSTNTNLKQAQSCEKDVTRPKKRADVVPAWTLARESSRHRRNDTAPSCTTAHISCSKSNKCTTPMASATHRTMHSSLSCHTPVANSVSMYASAQTRAASCSGESMRVAAEPVCRTFLQDSRTRHIPLLSSSPYTTFFDLYGPAACDTSTAASLLSHPSTTSTHRLVSAMDSFAYNGSSNNNNSSSSAAMQSIAIQSCTNGMTTRLPRADANANTSASVAATGAALFSSLPGSPDRESWQWCAPMNCCVLRLPLRRCVPGGAGRSPLARSSSTTTSSSSLRSGVHARRAASQSSTATVYATHRATALMSARRDESSLWCLDDTLTNLRRCCLLRCAAVTLPTSHARHVSPYSHSLHDHSRPCSLTLNSHRRWYSPPLVCHHDANGSSHRPHTRHDGDSLHNHHTTPQDSEHKPIICASLLSLEELADWLCRVGAPLPRSLIAHPQSCCVLPAAQGTLLAAALTRLLPAFHAAREAGNNCSFGGGVVGEKMVQEMRVRAGYREVALSCVYRTGAEVHVGTPWQLVEPVYATLFTQQQKQLQEEQQQQQQQDEYEERVWLRNCYHVHDEDTGEHDDDVSQHDVGAGAAVSRAVTTHPMKHPRRDECIHTADMHTTEHTTDVVYGSCESSDDYSYCNSHAQDRTHRPGKADMSCAHRTRPECWFGGGADVSRASYAEVCAWWASVWQRRAASTTVRLLPLRSGTTRTTTTSTATMTFSECDVGTDTLSARSPAPLVKVRLLRRADEVVLLRILSCHPHVFALTGCGVDQLLMRESDGHALLRRRCGWTVSWQLSACYVRRRRMCEEVSPGSTRDKGAVSSASLAAARTTELHPSSLSSSGKLWLSSSSSPSSTKSSMLSATEEWRLRTPPRRQRAHRSTSLQSLCHIPHAEERVTWAAVRKMMRYYHGWRQGRCGAADEPNRCRRRDANMGTDDCTDEERAGWCCDDHVHAGVGGTGAPSQPQTVAEVDAAAAAAAAADSVLLCSQTQHDHYTDSTVRANGSCSINNTATNYVVMSYTNCASRESHDTDTVCRAYEYHHRDEEEDDYDNMEEDDDDIFDGDVHCIDVHEDAELPTHLSSLHAHDAAIVRFVLRHHPDYLTGVRGCGVAEVYIADASVHHHRHPRHNKPAAETLTEVERVSRDGGRLMRVLLQRKCGTWVSVSLAACYQPTRPHALRSCYFVAAPSSASSSTRVRSSKDSNGCEGTVRPAVTSLSPHGEEEKGHMDGHKRTRSSVSCA